MTSLGISLTPEVDLAVKSFADRIFNRTSFPVVLSLLMITRLRGLGLRRSLPGVNRAVHEAGISNLGHLKCHLFPVGFQSGIAD